MCIFHFSLWLGILLCKFRITGTNLGVRKHVNYLLWWIFIVFLSLSSSFLQKAPSQIFDWILNTTLDDHHLNFELSFTLQLVLR